MLTFCFVPVEKVKETYWLPPQQICSFLLQLCCLSDTHFALVDSLANNFFLTSSFFFSHATTLNLNLYKIYAWFISLFISGQNFYAFPKSNCIIFRANIRYDMSFYLTSPTLFFKILCFFPLYTSIIPSSLDIHFIIFFCVCLWRANLIFLSLIGISVFFFTPNIFSSVRHSIYPRFLLYLGPIFQCFLWSFSVQLPHLHRH